MATRVTVRSVVGDARANGYLRTLRSRFPKAGLKSVVVADVYTIDAALSQKEISAAARCLTNATTEECSVGDVPLPAKCTCVIEIGFLPGVTDNVGHTAQETIADATGRVFKNSEAVYTSRFLFLDGPHQAEAEKMAGELYNPLIQRASVVPASAFKKGIAVVVPKVRLHDQQKADDVDLEVPDEELITLGKSGILNKDGTRRGPLALTLPSLHAIRDYFRTLKRKPTDVELESLAQTWSEHCKHTIFSDPLDEIREGIYRRYIKGATQHIRKKKGAKDFCVSVFTDNSGAISFDEKYLVTHKVETHNSPSALDPFGGSITGIVGVNRDCLGFGMGAKPIANVYGFCVGDPHEHTEYYRDAEKRRPVLSARRILEGVVRGVNTGGNQSGIPTPLGFVATDPRYNAKPLVFAGTVGLIPCKSRGRALEKKKARAGDYIVVIGGRVGLDGIHGATFSSEALSSGSPATAVQIGDPITQKKLSDALVREARDLGLYHSITDNGAGGLSCSVAEMAKECGGFEVDIEKIPLKYPGLSPWEIWISESQERMTLSVPKGKWKALKQLMDRHAVEATRIGVFTKAEQCVVRSRGKKVMDMAMDFLHEGRPIGEQRSEKPERKYPEPERSARSGDLGESLLGVLARPSVGRIGFISEQYDHEVQASSVTKPLQGRGRVNADAGVLQPLSESVRGIVLSHGYAPWYSDIDAYAMAAASIDTAVRNAVCAGASLDYLAILDNFCWSTSGDPKRLYELKEAARACYEMAVSYGTPFISGKDSMFNDFRGYTARGEETHIAVPPTLLVSAIGVVKDVRKSVTLDLKCAGDVLYLIGETNDELGASEYFTMLAEKSDGNPIGNAVPRVDPEKNRRAYNAFAQAVAKGLVASTIGVSRGGLAVALAKTAIAGQLGAHVDLSALPGKARAADAILFSESQGRIVASVAPKNTKVFEALFRGIPLARIGEVTKKESLDVELASSHAQVSLALLSSTYRKPFKNW